MIGQRAQGDVPNSPGEFLDILLLGFDLIFRNVRILCIALLNLSFKINVIRLSTVNVTEKPVWRQTSYQIAAVHVAVVVELLFLQSCDKVSIPDPGGAKRIE